MPARSTRPGVGAVAIWTSADLPGLGDQLLGRVIERELLARLPGWRMNLFAPLGWHKPSITDGGIVAEPLGAPSPTRAAQLAGAATLSVVCPAFPIGLDVAARYGDERAEAGFVTAGLGEDVEATHPVLPFAIRVADPVPGGLLSRASSVVVRDADSRDLLAKAGITAEVVPHPALLLDRVVDVATMPMRARQLRQLGVLPEGEYVVVALGEGAVPDAAALAGIDLPVVVLPVGEVPELGLRTVPTELVFEDRLAVLASATAVIATDEHVAAAATGLGVGWVLVDPQGSHRSVAAEFGDAEQLRTAFDRSTLAAASPGRPGVAVAVAAAFDRLAELAERALRSRGTELDRRLAALAEENAALRHAHWTQRQRILVERQRLADPLAQARLERDTATDEASTLRAANRELHRRNDELAARLAACEQELSAWRNTKLVRWTRPLREVYGKARG